MYYQFCDFFQNLIPGPNLEEWWNLTVSYSNKAVLVLHLKLLNLSVIPRFERNCIDG